MSETIVGTVRELRSFVDYDRADGSVRAGVVIDADGRGWFLDGPAAFGDEMAAVSPDSPRVARRSAACAARYAEKDRPNTACPHGYTATRTGTCSSDCVEGHRRAAEKRAAHEARTLCNHPGVTGATQCLDCEAGERVRGLFDNAPDDYLSSPHPHIPADVPKEAIDRLREAAAKPMDIECTVAWRVGGEWQIGYAPVTNGETAAEAGRRIAALADRDNDRHITRMIAMGRSEPLRDSAVAALTHERIAPPSSCEGCGYRMLRSERWVCGACGHRHAMVRA